MNDRIIPQTAAMPRSINVHGPPPVIAIAASAPPPARIAIVRIGLTNSAVTVEPPFRCFHTLPVYPTITQGFDGRPGVGVGGGGGVGVGDGVGVGVGVEGEVVPVPLMRFQKLSKNFVPPVIQTATKS